MTNIVQCRITVTGSNVVQITPELRASYALRRLSNNKLTRLLVHLARSDNSHVAIPGAMVRASDICGEMQRRLHVVLDRLAHVHAGPNQTTSTTLQP